VCGLSDKSLPFLTTLACFFFFLKRLIIDILEKVFELIYLTANDNNSLVSFFKSKLL